MPNIVTVTSTGFVVTPSLDDAKTAKIAELRQAYENAVAAGFTASVSGTTYTFGATDSDLTHMTATQKAIEKAFESFPVDYSDINGAPVSIPDQTTLDAVEQAMTTFLLSKHKEIQTLVGQAQAATTVDDVNAVSWS